MTTRFTVRNCITGKTGRRTLLNHSTTLVGAVVLGTIAPLDLVRAGTLALWQERLVADYQHKIDIRRAKIAQLSASTPMKPTQIDQVNLFEQQIKVLIQKIANIYSSAGVTPPDGSISNPDIYSAPQPLPTEFLQCSGTELHWNGEPVRLYGPNFNVFSSTYDSQTHVAQIASIRQLWGGNCVRLNIAPAEFRERSSSAFWAHLQPIIEECRKQNMFAILNYWCIGWPGDGSHNVDRWFRFDNYNDTSIDLWTRFWDEAAARLKNRGDVMFSLWDEPTTNYNGSAPKYKKFDQWYYIQPHYQRILNNIRNIGAMNAISISGGHYASDFSRWNERPLDDRENNLIADIHFFLKGEWKNYDRFMNGLDRKIPVICGGWGYVPDDRSSPPNAGYEKWLREHAFPSGNFIGHMPWAHSRWSNPSGLATGWPQPSESLTLSAYGRYARANFASNLIRP